MFSPDDIHDRVMQAVAAGDRGWRGAAVLAHATYELPQAIDVRRCCHRVVLHHLGDTLGRRIVCSLFLLQVRLGIHDLVGRLGHSV